MSNVTFIVGTKELLPIHPLHAGAAVVPDLVSVVRPGTDPADATFGAPGTIDSQPAVWVQSLTPGTYKVLCKMNVQGDSQQPIWELDGAIIVKTA